MYKYKIHIRQRKGTRGSGASYSAVEIHTNDLRNDFVALLYIYNTLQKNICPSGTYFFIEVIEQISLLRWNPL